MGSGLIILQISLLPPLIPRLGLVYLMHCFGLLHLEMT